MASFTVNVREIWGKPIAFEVYDSTSVLFLKDLVMSQMNIPSEVQLLSIDEHQLKAEERNEVGETLRELTLADHNLKDGAEIVLTDYSSLRPSAIGSAIPLIIPETQHRGITAQQLRKVRGFLMSCCSVDGWTAAWIDSNSSSSSYRQKMHRDKFNLYQAVEWVVLPATYFFKCSFVEFMAEDVESQIPRWFASHWWGESLMRFIDCLDEHTSLRQLDEAHTPYWVCAYANNQHELMLEITQNPKNTSFYKAMQNCAGVLLIVDEQAVSLTRIWCSYETAIAMNSKQLLFDIATAAPWTEGSKGEISPRFRKAITTHTACVITDGLVPEDRQEEAFRGGRGLVRKATREAHFPWEIIDKAMQIDIEASQASLAVDRARILNSLAGVNSNFLGEDPPKGHIAYDRVNKRLHSIFAQAGFLIALLADQEERLQKIMDAFKEDDGGLSLHIWAATSMYLTDKWLSCLVGGLNPSLRRFCLNIHSCRRVTSDGISNLFQHLPASLRSLSLTLSNVPGVDSHVASVLASNLPSNLLALTLELHYCSLLTGTAVSGIVSNLPQRLRKLELVLANCKLVDDAAGKDIARKLPRTLQVLWLDLWGTNVGEGTAFELLKSITELSSLHTLHVQVNNTRICPASAKRISEVKLVPIPKDLHLDFSLCLDESFREGKLESEEILASSSATLCGPDVKMVLDSASKSEESFLQASFPEENKYQLSEIVRDKMLQRVSDTTDIFRNWDQNGDGRITIGELEAVLTDLGCFSNKEEALQVFKQMDESNDGHVSYSEFIAWLYSR